MSGVGSTGGAIYKIRNIFILPPLFAVMMIGTALFVIAVLIIGIWVVVEIKRMRHKIFAIFLIAVILFLYFSITTVFKEKQVDLTSVSGISDAVKVYFSWLGGAFSNLKSLTANVINMNWKGNSTG